MSDNPMQAFNRKIIDEFRANDGVVGGDFANAAMMLLNTIGAKSGQPRTNPLVYISDGDDLIIVASYGGADKHPPWFHNLVANPLVEVEVGAEKYTANARVVPEPSRSEIYARMADSMSAFTEYQAKTSRVIPVVRLERA